MQLYLAVSESANRLANLDAALAQLDANDEAITFYSARTQYPNERPTGVESPQYTSTLNTPLGFRRVGNLFGPPEIRHRGVSENVPGPTYRAQFAQLGFDAGPAAV